MILTFIKNIPSVKLPFKPFKLSKLDTWKTDY